jgi:uncharacterized protein
MGELRLSEIWIYPIKSLGGIRANKAQVFEKGLEYDRRWMLVDTNGHFMTQRTYPQMALFQVAIENNRLTIHHKKNQAQYSFAMDAHQPHAKLVTIWEDSVQAVEVHPQASKWFSEQLNLPCKLVYFPEGNPRAVDPNYTAGKENVSLADGYPFLIVGQASLDDLNNRLPEPVTISRFRPNFVFTGGLPYEEDDWQQFFIGNNRFNAIKKCGRCTLTTVDPLTGTKGTEPLQTLAGYRKSGSKVYFGQNAVAIDHGTISQGDLIARL